MTAASLQLLIALAVGWGMDRLLGDPQRWPHPVVWFGRAIGTAERRLNHGRHRRLKGAAVAAGLTVGVFLLAVALRRGLATLMPPLAVAPGVTVAPLSTAFDALAVFYCLAGTTLIREVRQVFMALDRSLSEGRAQVARIVGRDTSELTAQEVRTAALETLAENLSDGVVAPLFWLALLGTPGMLAYKMVNTLDSMVGYRTDRYRDFGRWAARQDDVANYLPARLTALLMVVCGVWKDFGGWRRLSSFVCRYGRCHASPNSGWPEAALAGVLDCRFGGPHYYFGQLFDKPYIGTNPRPLTTADMLVAVRLNRQAEVLMVVLTALAIAAISLS